MTVDDNSTETQVPPSLLSATFAAGTCGVNVNALFKKYSELDSRGEKASTASQNKPSSSRKLDSMRICNICNGLGLCQITYSHQIREVNCDNCDGEGTLEK